MLIFASVPAQAAIFWWDGGVVDIPGAGEGVSLGGSGDWSTAIANWDDGLSHVVWPSAGTDNGAILGGTAGTVSLTTPITLQNLTFETTGYTLAGAGANVLTFGGTTPTITNGTGISATISSPISGATVTKAGAGVLTLSGVNTNTGLTVSAGTLQLSGAGTLGASGATLIGSPVPR